MSRTFLTSIDFSNLELLNGRFQNLASAPSSPTEGKFYYDTVLHALGVYQNGTWIYLGSGGYTDEQAQDAVAALIAAGTQTNITATYNDAANTLSFSVAADGASGTPTLRTLGTSSTSAAAGNDSRLSDARTPSAGSVTNSSVAVGAAISSDKLADGTTNGVYTLAERTKLSGIATGATNYTNANAQANRLDQFAAPTASVSMNSQKITNLLDPSGPQDAVTKTYADGLRQGISVKDPVAVASTANLTLSGEQTIDGFTTSASRILVKNQTTTSANGIYVTASGAWTRATDADATGEITEGTAVWIQGGTTQGNTRWVQTGAAPITIGTTAQTWTQDFAATSTTAGAGLTASGNVFAVGAGTGITVAADSVAIDTSVVTQKATYNVGDGSTTSIVLTHTFNTRDVEVQVYRNSTPWDQVEPDIQRTSTTTVTLVFATAPTSNQYRAIIQG